MRKAIEILSKGENINGELLVSCIEDLLTGQASAAQIGAFLVLLKVDQLQSQPRLIYMASQKIISHSMECPVTGEELFDIVGTGGDNLDTWNVSSASAFLLGACGVKVVKHGSRSNSGRIGSADFIEALGANILIDNLKVSKIIEEIGFGFLFSQLFHPALKIVSGFRKEIGVRTIFNILGPLVNPTRPTHMLVGVSLPELGGLYASILAENPRIKKAFVVHSKSGMDELGIDGETLVWMVSNGNVTELTLSPEDFGVQRRPISSIIGGETALDNAKIFTDVLQRIPTVESYSDWLCMNGACGLVLLGKAPDWKTGFKMSKQAIADGSVKKLLDQYISKTNQI